VLVREVLLGRSNVVEVLVLAIEVKGKLDTQGDPTADADVESGVEEHVQGRDLPVMIRFDDVVLEIHLRDQDLVGSFRPIKHAIVWDATKGEIQRHFPGGIDPLLGAGHEKAIGGSAARLRRNPYSEEQERSAGSHTQSFATRIHRTSSLLKASP